MQGANTELASYSDPPVVEVVVGVSFKHLAGLSLTHMGLLWDAKFRELFPNSQEQPPYDPPVENFPSRPGEGMSLQLGNMPPLPRLWFLSEDGDELVQVQRNWFACNWRKVDPESKYGRWPERRRAFESTFELFREYIEEHDLGRVEPFQAEVTYINHITPNEHWQHHGQLDRILNLVGTGGDALGVPESMRLNVQYVMPSDQGGDPAGRLHVTAEPGYRREDETPIYKLNLTARGRPRTEQIEDVFAFLEDGRRWIVSGFESMTTSEMNEVWGRHV